MLNIYFYIILIYKNQFWEIYSGQDVVTHLTCLTYKSHGLPTPRDRWTKHLDRSRKTIPVRRPGSASGLTLDEKESSDDDSSRQIVLGRLPLPGRCAVAIWRGSRLPPRRWRTASPPALPYPDSKRATCLTSRSSRARPLSLLGLTLSEKCMRKRGGVRKLPEPPPYSAPSPSPHPRKCLRHYLGYGSSIKLVWCKAVLTEDITRSNYRSDYLIKLLSSQS